MSIVKPQDFLLQMNLGLKTTRSHTILMISPQDHPRSRHPWLSSRYSCQSFLGSR